MDCSTPAMTMRRKEETKQVIVEKSPKRFNVKKKEKEKKEGDNRESNGF